MNKKKHLTDTERIKPQALLARGFSIRSIADFLEKSPSTISREIQKHSIVKIPNSCDCNDYNGSNVKHVCGSKDCNKKCRSCHFAKKYCEHYNKRSCEHWNGSSIKLCNGCTKRGYCHLEKHFYDIVKNFESELDIDENSQIQAVYRTHYSEESVPEYSSVNQIAHTKMGSVKITISL